MVRKASYVSVFAVSVVITAAVALNFQLPIGPVILVLTLIPVAGILVARKSLKRAIPDMVFGAIDTGLLSLAALWGGILFGVAGAVAGSVIGDAITDAVAGFFEGSIAEWFRKKGIEESRESITTSLGKMAGCLIGSGAVLTVALIFGVKPESGQGM